MAKINTKNELPTKSVDDYNITPCDVIFKHTEKPENYLFCKSVNIYDDRWRVNIYSKREVHGIDSKYISKSYAVVFSTKTGELKLLS